MKILLISKTLVNEAHFLNIKPFADIDGLDLFVVGPHKFKGKKAKASFFERRNFFTEKLIFSNSFHFSLYPKIGKLILKIKPDLVHIDDEPYNFVTFHIARIVRNFGLRYIFVCLQNILKSFPMPFNMIEEYVINNADGIIARNTEAKKILVKKGAVKRIEVIPYGIDASMYYKREMSELRKTLGLENCFVVGYCGRLVQEKGIDTLIEAMASIRKSSKLLLMGEGNYKQRIVKKIDVMGMSDACNFVGEINPLKLPDYFNCLDCLVLPSLTTISWKEQFGRVLIEAMGCGIPVIGSSSGEIPNVIGDAGLIFPEGDVVKLRAAILNLIENRNLRNEYAEKGRSRVMKYFTNEIIAEKTYNFYMQIITEK